MHQEFSFQTLSVLGKWKAPWDQLKGIVDFPGGVFSFFRNRVVCTLVGGGCKDKHLHHGHWALIFSWKKLSCLCVVVDAAYESGVEDEDATQKFLVESKLPNLKVSIASWYWKVTEHIFTFYITLGNKVIWHILILSRRDRNLLKNGVIGIAYCGHCSKLTQFYGEAFQLFREDKTNPSIIDWEASNRKRADVVANSSKPRPWHKSKSQASANNSSKLAPAGQLADEKITNLWEYCPTLYLGVSE